jgi:hypothetical protein
MSGCSRERKCDFIEAKIESFLLSLTVESEETIIATDNTHWALMGKCIHGNLKAWYVMTPSTDPLSSTAKKQIVGIVKGLGFIPKYGSMISYDKCPKPKPTKPTPKPK